MVITGRVPLLLLLGLVPVVLRPEASTVRLWLLVVAVLITADVLLAPREEPGREPPVGRHRPDGGERRRESILYANGFGRRPKTS